MSPYIETLKLLHGELKNLQFHQLRFEKTRKEMLGMKKHPSLQAVIQIPDGLEQGLFRCRVIYGKEVERIEFEPQETRRINSLKVVISDTIAYAHKSSDRSELEQLFRQRDHCDDIIIVKNKYITDSYTANLVLWDGKSWQTPDTPLLPGTMRAYLLSQGKITESEITLSDLKKFKSIRLINALNNMEEAEEILTDQVFY